VLLGQDGFFSCFKTTFCQAENYFEIEAVLRKTVASAASLPALEKPRTGAPIVSVFESKLKPKGGPATNSNQPRPKRLGPPMALALRP
jgi:hypothetical protein